MGTKLEEDVHQALTEGDKMRGLGDAVAKVTKKLGVPECTPCQQRRARLNKLVPFGRKRPR